MSAEIPSGLGVLQRIQEVLEGHRHDFNADGHINGTIPGLGTHDCWCGEAFSTTDMWAEHVAALVLALFTEQLSAHRKFVAALIADTDLHPSGVCPVCSYLWPECTCDVTERES